MKCFIGIDQTGAALRNGTAAKPLPTAILFQPRGGEWTLHVQHPDTRTKLCLNSLSQDAFLALTKKFGLENLTPRKIALLVDCVFGLARDVRIPGRKEFWPLFQSTGNLYGRKASTRFFEKLLQTGCKESKDFPRRKCELLSGANSVFQTHPFQKNIQTGTYRIWKDLVVGESKRSWLNFWPFIPEKAAPNRPWIFEGYPSLFWREIFGLPTRNRSKLRAAFETHFPGKQPQIEDWTLIESDPDLADAAVLALGGLALYRRKKLFHPYKGFKPGPGHWPEGWIAGLTDKMEKSA